VLVQLNVHQRLELILPRRYCKSQGVLFGLIPGKRSAWHWPSSFGHSPSQVANNARNTSSEAEAARGALSAHLPIARHPSCSSIVRICHLTPTHPLVDIWWPSTEKINIRPHTISNRKGTCITSFCHIMKQLHNSSTYSIHIWQRYNLHSMEAHTGFVQSHRDTRNRIRPHKVATEIAYT
jgi:hypothetical protein